MLAGVGHEAWTGRGPPPWDTASSDHQSEVQRRWNVKEAEFAAEWDLRVKTPPEELPAHGSGAAFARLAAAQQRKSAAVAAASSVHITALDATSTTTIRPMK